MNLSYLYKRCLTVIIMYTRGEYNFVFVCCDYSTIKRLGKSMDRKNFKYLFSCSTGLQTKGKTCLKEGH